MPQAAPHRYRASDRTLHKFGTAPSTPGPKPSTSERANERAAVHANMQLHLKSHAAFTEDSSRKGASRAFAAASATKKSRASVDQRRGPPRLPCSPHLRALGKCAPFAAEQTQAPPRWSCRLRSWVCRLSSAQQPTLCQSPVVHLCRVGDRRQQLPVFCHPMQLLGASPCPGP